MWSGYSQTPDWALQTDGPPSDQELIEEVENLLLLS